jgi:hypothetical protein
MGHHSFIAQMFYMLNIILLSLLLCSKYFLFKKQFQYFTFILLLLFVFVLEQYCPSIKVLIFLLAFYKGGNFTLYITFVNKLDSKTPISTTYHHQKAFLLLKFKRNILGWRYGSSGRMPA